MLIETWLPVDTLGAESMRERGASSALPPLYFLHVWWARRPLLVSRAAILASALPAWSEDWPAALKSEFPTEEKYRAWFLKLCGIFGDPVAGRKLIAKAKETNARIKGGPYSHPRAFTVNPSEEILRRLRMLLEHAWGKSDLTLLDPFAGGGSIPFEGLRYGFTTTANELNPVAVTILRATLDYPRRFGRQLAEDIRSYGNAICTEVRRRLEPFFPVTGNESVHAYIWARTVKCPYTGKLIPLSPNWWLRKGSEPVAVKPIFEPDAEEARFEIVRGRTACERAKPDVGTVRKGDAVSPWVGNQVVDGDYIKAEAQAGRMGQQLYALAIKRDRGFEFRAPTEEDLVAVAAAEEELARRLPEWGRKGWVPADAITRPSNYDRGHRLYGMEKWADLFSPRQLLSLVTFLEVFQETKARIVKELPEKRARAAVTYLGLSLDKAADYDSRMACWHSDRLVMSHTFDRHDFSLKWSHGEFDASRNLFPWALDQVIDAYTGLAELAAPDPLSARTKKMVEPVQITCGTAADMRSIPDASIDVVCGDPPYSDNVMYAECSDFFYVWQKRTLGDVYPGLFRDELTNKDDEAVANVARFASAGKKRKVLAKVDYERKMAACFREIRRVLRDDGVLTVMFTHKKVEAWDSLATSLIGSGFTIHSSWPVHTESEHSLHQAKKNAAQSTILLTCKKREAAGEPVWWDDIKAKVRQTARDKAQEFEAQGIRGVDLYISTFGPTLSIISENWPVLTGEVDEATGKPRPLRPDVALDLAREEVIALRKQGLLLGRAVDFDPVTDWYLMAWDAFGAQEFPADEARKLALAMGLDIEKDLVAEKRIIGKKQSTVVLKTPKERRKHGMVDVDRTDFTCWIDALHTAMLAYIEDGARACQTFLGSAGLRTDSTFKACLSAAIRAIPRTKDKGKYVRSEAEILENMRLNFFDDIEVPKEEEPGPEFEQTEYRFPEGEEAEEEEPEEGEE